MNTDSICRAWRIARQLALPLALPLSLPLSVLAVAAMLVSAAPAQADAVSAPTARPVLGQHPAVLVQRRVQGIDPNRFIVQPPASVRWTVQAEAQPAPSMATSPADAATAAALPAPKAPFDETPITPVETAGAAPNA